MTGRNGTALGGAPPEAFDGVPGQVGGRGRAAGRPAPDYADAAVTAGSTAMRAVHLQELRLAVVALEGTP